MFLKSKRERVQIDFSGKKSLTKQSMAKACNINNIMKRYQKTGLIEHVKQGGSYGDFSNISSYQEALNQIIQAQESFETLAAPIRSRFNNDPDAFVKFIDDPKNKPEAIELGLIERPAEPEPKPAPEPSPAPAPP